MVGGDNRSFLLLFVAFFNPNQPCSQCVDRLMHLKGFE